MRYVNDFLCINVSVNTTQSKRVVGVFCNLILRSRSGTFM